MILVRKAEGIQNGLPAVNEWDQLVSKIGALALAAGYLEMAIIAMVCRILGKSENEVGRHHNKWWCEKFENGIWEGTGNVICLDVLRSMQREPNCVPALLDELRLAQGVDRRYDAALRAIEADLVGLSRQEEQARRLVERLALIASASLLLRHAPDAVADAFMATRIEGGFAGHFGDLPSTVDRGYLARRAIPA
ncbi:MAG: hypothetical protein ACLPXW_20790 [Xanthobacteraceae bacterium]